MLTSSGVKWIMRWIERMSAAYGGVVYIAEGYGEPGESWVGYDWGQALCREMYGPRYADWPDEPETLDIERAQQWEAGDWPEWAEQPEEARDES